MATTSPGPDAKAPAEPLGVLPAGTILHGFEVVSVLGHGGFGITYLARDTKLDREVAIKEYLPTSLALRHGGTTVMPRSTELADDFVWGRERFLDEARTLAKLEGTPAVVRVIDFLEENGTAYTVMALAKGQTLDRIVKQKGPLPAPAVERLLGPLLDGVERVHKAGFLHRDIKPANIIVDDEGIPTLIDFGASRAAIAGHTAAMTAIFTPGFAAAEQFTSSKQGPWTDIYGLSATLYNVITGKIPPSAFDRMLDDAYETIVGQCPTGFPLGLLAGIDAGLAVRAGDRPQSIADWRAMLHLGEAPVSAPASDVTAVMRKPRPPAPPAHPPTATAPLPPAAASPATNRRLRRLGIAAVVLLIIFASSHKGRALLFGEQPAGPTPAEQAQIARQRFEEVAAKAKAQAEAKVAEAEAKARVKAAEAEAKAKADADAQAKAAADAKTKAEANAAAAKAAAETAETALKLSIQDRQRLQVALTSLGFDTQGADGTFGQRTRDMIAGWQNAHGQFATGFLNALQEQAVLSEGAPAVKKFDDEQKKAEEAAKPKVAAAVPSPAPAAAAPTPSPGPAVAPAPPAAPAATTTAFDGVWSVTLICPDHANAKAFKYIFNLTVTNGAARGAYGSEGVPGYLAISGQIPASGNVIMTVHGLVGDPKHAIGSPNSGAPVYYTFPATFSGRSGTGTRTELRPCTYTFTKQ